MSSSNGTAYGTRIDTDAAEQAAANLLHALGADLTQEGLPIPEWHARLVGVLSGASVSS